MSETIQTPPPVEAEQGTLPEAAQFSEADIARRQKIGEIGLGLTGADFVIPVLDLPVPSETPGTDTESPADSPTPSLKTDTTPTFIAEKQYLLPDGRVVAGPTTEQIVPRALTSDEKSEYRLPADYQSPTEQIPVSQMQKAKEENAAWSQLEAEKNAEALEKEASTDPLTGLMNRRGVEKAVGAVGEENASGVIMLDMNKLKWGNDYGENGHETGDAMIMEGASILQKSREVRDHSDPSKILRTIDTVAIGRLGGDEFVIVLGPDATPEDAELIQQNITELSAQSTVHKLIPKEGAPDNLPSEVQLSFSMGHTDKFGSVSEGMKEADALMYAQKHGTPVGQVPARDERR